MNTSPFHLFDVYGVELEYMIVDRETLDVRPITDQFLRRLGEEPGASAEADEGSDPGWPGNVGVGSLSWSNELTLHVAELKTAEPAPSLDPLADAFASEVTRASTILAELGCRLLPAGTHPWMNPDREMRLWPHDYSPVYQAFHQIFDCRGHGWANLQACHLNLPFVIEQDTPRSEFGRLHAAIRVLLPLLPALAASTPVMDTRLTGLLDSRLETYRTNSRKVPQATGRVIPERVFTRADYEAKILEPIYEAYRRFDPDGMLRHEWANSRGAIARFTRGSIEIRVLDVQECPRADVAICQAITRVLRGLCDASLGDLDTAMAIEVDPLHALLLDTIRNADRAIVSHEPLLRALGWHGAAPAPITDLWHDLLDRAGTHDAPWRPTIDTVLREGCLARRIVNALAGDTSHANLHRVWSQLANCLEHNRLFGV